jgi:hypothetical protein
MTDESSALEQPYEIVLVRRAKPPPGAEGSDWHRYVITFEGRNSIYGCRQGDLRAVTRAVEEIVGQLNQRHLGKRGRVNLVPTPNADIQASVDKPIVHK